MLLLYNIFVFFALLIALPWMFLKAWRRGDKPNWKQRAGDMPALKKSTKGRLWIHAVSVGEVMAVLPILREIKNREPELEIILSTHTPGGRRTAAEHAVELVDHIVEFPIDTPRFQLNAMMRLRPSAVAVMETELWMNFFWAAKSIGAHTAVINGRLSDRSFPRAKVVRPFYAALLKFVDLCLVQTETDRERFAALGAKEPIVFGNCKFDQAVADLDADPVYWREELGLDPKKTVIVIGSTRGEKEEQLVLSMLEYLSESKRNDIQFIHAPRHLDRVDELEREVAKRINDVARRSRGESGQYLILDTFGELSKVYCVADFAIVGGGFDNLGGQNLIQPLAHGKPVLHGTHMQNFRDVTEAANRAGCTICLESDPELLALTIQDLMADGERCREMGHKAKAFVADQLGASHRYAETLIDAATSAKGLLESN